MEDQQIKKFQQEIEAAVLETPDQVEEFRLRWLSKKGRLQELFGRIKEIPNEDKKTWGQLVNDLKNLTEEKWRTAKEAVDAGKDAGKQAQDLTLEGTPFMRGGLHPLTLVRNELVGIFSRLGFVISEGPEIVDEWHNFTALNMPSDHPARDMADTFFVQTSPEIVLRTHTSSVQVEVMQRQKPPIRTISPGRVFRKDNDATHSPVFHQIEGLYVDEGVSFSDLKQTLFHFAQELFGKGTEIRFRASYFPFTEPSAEMDITWKKVNPETGKEEVTWLEVLGCGMVDPAVLENCGIDSEKYTGFAFGIGIERIAMVKYNIQDIRLFYENDIRFLEQFKNEV